MTERDPRVEKKATEFSHKRVSVRSCMQSPQGQYGVKDDDQPVARVMSRLEKLTNAVVLISCVMLLGALGRNFYLSQSMLVLSTQCHFCQDGN